MAETELNILYLNIRSLRNKLDDIVDIIGNKDYGEVHIMVLTETWIYDNETSSFNIEGFNAVHDCRNTRGGGTSIYVRNSLSYTQNNLIVDLCECNVLSIHLVQENLNIISVYRPPNCKIQDFITELDKILESQRRNCILVGDMNINLLEN